MTNEPEVHKWKYFLAGLKEPALSLAAELKIDDEEYCCVKENHRETIICVDKDEDLLLIEWHKNENRLEINKI